MSEERYTYVIDKLFEPEEAPAYAASLVQLPGEEEALTPYLPVILKKREMTPVEARMVHDRPHVYRVTRDYTVRMPPQPTIGSDGIRATMDQVVKYHGFDKAFARNMKGQKRLVVVGDTGIAPAWFQKESSRIPFTKSFVPGEDWKDTISGHATWCGSWILLNAPEARVAFSKVLSTRTGSGSMSGIADMINDAVASGATEISLSLGGVGSTTDPLSRAVNAARSLGVIVICAAGNDQRGTNSFTADNHSPGCAGGAVTVACGDLAGNLADFSSWGNCVDVRSVGVESQSGDLQGGLTSYMSGTSMSTPVVAAACAVLGSGRGREAADLVEKALYSTTGDTLLPSYKEGHGIMDVEFAVAKILGSVAPAPAPSPYKPGVKRMSMNAFHNLPPEPLENPVVVTYRRKDFAYCEPKGE